MTRRKRRNHSASLKAKVALAALRGDKTIAELVQQFDVHANHIQDWKRRLLDEADNVFEVKASASGTDSSAEVAKLHAKQKPATRPAGPAAVQSRACWLGATLLFCPCRSPCQHGCRKGPRRHPAQLPALSARVDR